MPSNAERPRLKGVGILKPDPWNGKTAVGLNRIETLSLPPLPVVTPAERLAYVPVEKIGLADDVSCAAEVGDAVTKFEVLAPPAAMAEVSEATKGDISTRELDFAIDTPAASGISEDPSCGGLSGVPA